MTQHEAHVVGSWWASGAGWLMSAWAWASAGMSPLAALLAVLTVILTAIKIAQEVRAWRRDAEDRTALQKLLDRLTKRSGFGKLDSPDSKP